MKKICTIMHANKPRTDNDRELHNKYENIP